MNGYERVELVHAIYIGTLFYRVAHQIKAGDGHVEKSDSKGPAERRSRGYA